ncbi:hypothetical protein HK102_000682 [Quaeritorhiza haematococci]|nr:hypothetical protein HK102_000682 [Quaeritorhiza haematococci]
MGGNASSIITVTPAACAANHVNNANANMNGLAGFGMSGHGYPNWFVTGTQGQQGQHGAGYHHTTKCQQQTQPQPAPQPKQQSNHRTYANHSQNSTAGSQQQQQQMYGAPPGFNPIAAIPVPTGVYHEIYRGYGGGNQNRSQNRGGLGSGGYEVGMAQNIGTAGAPANGDKDGNYGDLCWKGLGPQQQQQYKELRIDVIDYAEVFVDSLFQCDQFPSAAPAADYPSPVSPPLQAAATSLSTTQQHHHPRLPLNPYFPSLSAFIHNIMSRTRISLTVLIAGLYYLRRLKELHPACKGSPGSGHRLALAALIVASKYLNDDTYDNKAWTSVCCGMYRQEEVNRMEMEFLHYLEYKLGIEPEDWAAFVGELDEKVGAMAAGRHLRRSSSSLGPGSINGKPTHGRAALHPLTLIFCDEDVVLPPQQSSSSSSANGPANSKNSATAIAMAQLDGSTSYQSSQYNASASYSLNPFHPGSHAHFQTQQHTAGTVNAVTDHSTRYAAPLGPTSKVGSITQPQSLHHPTLGAAGQPAQTGNIGVFSQQPEMMMPPVSKLGAGVAATTDGKAAAAAVAAAAAAVAGGHIINGNQLHHAPPPLPLGTYGFPNAVIHGFGRLLHSVFDSRNP